MKPSRAPYSNQTGPHPDLDTVVHRHLRTAYRRPISAATCEVFAQLQALVERHNGDLVVDAGCGTGQSSALLAARFGEALVIGVDKSAHRLQRQLGEQSLMQKGNLVVCRANLIDFWRLAASAGWRLARHYLLYPNPWPRKQQLQRRWHGHAVLPAILALGGRLEVRSNWQEYIHEFSRALALAGVDSDVDTVAEGECLTPFEKKYRHSGHQLYYCLGHLDDHLAPFG